MSNLKSATGTKELAQLLLEHVEQEINRGLKAKRDGQLHGELVHLAGFALMWQGHIIRNLDSLRLQTQPDEVATTIYGWYHDHVLPAYVKWARTESGNKETATWAKTFEKSWRHWRWVEWKQWVAERKRLEAEIKEARRRRK